MSTISINLSTTDLLKGVEQLEQTELEDFVKQVLYIRAKRIADSLSNEETVLLEQINAGLTDEEKIKLHQFAEKSQEDILTTQQHQEYMKLIEKLEHTNNNRLTALGKLSQLRKIPLLTLMEQLGLNNSELN